MSQSIKVAIITGGASGMGLAVATALSKKNWQVYLLDFNEEAGKAAAQALQNATFMKTNVSSWKSLSEAFDAVFESHGAIDFVFANAGIVERDNFYAKVETPRNSRIPPEINQTTIDINMKGVISTSYLAQHYFRLSPHKGKDAVLVMTASVGGIVRCYSR
jgi:NAD(P)-dependent dehydrogenase (short-subunit alcohol dehydrogenase family)